MHLSAAIGYLPRESIKENKRIIFETLLKLIQSKNENIPKDAIIDQLFGFVASNEHLDLSLSWI